ncbi:MAG: alpha-hydroxy-acid oxidizing protein [bacterium]|nr:alpha-hydroxy-acid oxidizing protein [bacterium]
MCSPEATSSSCFGTGADAVMVGRAVLYALACNGEADVARMIRTLREELATIHMLVNPL